jgi:hypothetical protein
MMARSVIMVKFTMHDFIFTALLMHIIGRKVNWGVGGGGVQGGKVFFQCKVRA